MSKPFATRPGTRERFGATVALCVMLAGCATGQSASPNLSATDTVFLQAASTWDLDKDGVVTCEEWKTYARDLLRSADGNGDSALTRDEFAKMAKVDRLFATADFTYFDANGDGSVTLAELVEKPNPAFGYLDKNHDCRLTADEMPSAWSGPSGRSTGAQQGSGQRGNRGPR